jgi:hypothetical protein
MQTSTDKPTSSPSTTNSILATQVLSDSDLLVSNLTSSDVTQNIYVQPAIDNPTSPVKLNVEPPAIIPCPKSDTINNNRQECALPCV